MISNLTLRNLYIAATCSSPCHSFLRPLWTIRSACHLPKSPVSQTSGSPLAYLLEFSSEESGTYLVLLSAEIQDGQ